MTLDHELVERIYEAAALPELWPVVLDRLCAVSGAHAGALLTFGEGVPLSVAATEIYDIAYRDVMASGQHYENVRPGRALARYPMAFVSDLEICTAAELEQDPLYIKFLRPHGIGWTAGTVAPVPSGDTLVFDIAQKLGAQPFRRETMELLDSYRPHLARAALLAHRLGLRNARSQTDAMQTIGLPATVLADGGRLLAANALFESLAPRFLLGAFDRLVLADRKANQLLQAVISRAATHWERAVHSIPIPATEEGPALVVHLIPVRRSGHDIFSRALALLIVTPVTRPEAPSTQLLMGLFDLTPAEARVASGIAGGLDVGQMASRFAVSRDTVRNQLRAVLAKTGVRRQAELALLLTGARPVNSPG